MSLSVLLRDGNHGGTEKVASTRFALLIDRLSITIARTPIQVPIPQNRPQLIDIGSIRPNMSISGTIDTIGLTENTEANENAYYMQSTTYTLYNTPTTDIASNQTYYIPYKNVLEDFLYYVTYDESSSPLQLEILGPKDPPSPIRGRLSGASRFHTIPTGAFHTGGGIYNVAIQNASFNLEASKEDRYSFSLALVATNRLDQKDSAMGVDYSPAGYDPFAQDGVAINKKGTTGLTGPAAGDGGRGAL